MMRDKRRAMIYGPMLVLLAMTPLAVTAYGWLLPDRMIYEVNRVEVASHMVGHIPQVIYSRTIHRPFSAQWFVETKRAVDGQTMRACKGNGWADYEPGENHNRKWLLDEFVGASDCNNLPPGCYYLQTAWHLKLFGVPRIIRNRSETFCRYL